ncbi:MAG: hypothetical protein K2H66_05005, partial [Oscillospiraceae bacterium]|nr:hypothetical protein [Oscillospiraceae bacterium]
VSCKDSPYGKFCANQGLIFFILCTVLNVAQTFLRKIFLVIPFVGHIFPKLLSFVIAVIEFAIFLLLLISACQGKAKRIPFIGRLFEAFN